jgi:hypothetical protein
MGPFSGSDLDLFVGRLGAVLPLLGVLLRAGLDTSGPGERLILN